MSVIKTNCCLCDAEMDHTVLRTPFSYEPDEYPKRYGPVCDSCFRDCQDGKRTKEEFNRAVAIGMGL